jgi:cytochrome c556
MRSIIFVASLLLAACSSDTQVASAKPPVDLSAAQAGTEAGINPPDTGEPLMHAVQNEQLQKIMRQLNNLVYSRMTEDIDLNELRKTKTTELAQVARELAQNEQEILQTLPDLDLNEEEKLLFTSLERKLHRNALKMEELAVANNLAEIPGTLDVITSTCISCHSLFRKQRSLIEKCRDPNYTC